MFINVLIIGLILQKILNYSNYHLSLTIVSYFSVLMVRMISMIKYKFYFDCKRNVWFYKLIKFLIRSEVYMIDYVIQSIWEIRCPIPRNQSDVKINQWYKDRNLSIYQILKYRTGKEDTKESGWLPAIKSSQNGPIWQL